MALMNDAPLLRLAGRQHGLVTTRQLLALGFTGAAIRRRVDAGVLFRVHRGVYAVAGSRDKGLLDRRRDEARDEQCGLTGWTVRRYSTDDIRLLPAGIAADVTRLRGMAEAA